MSRQVAVVVRAMPERAGDAREFERVMTRHFYSADEQLDQTSELKRVRELFSRIRRGKIKRMPGATEQRQDGGS